MSSGCTLWLEEMLLYHLLPLGSQYTPLNLEVRLWCGTRRRRFLLLAFFFTPPALT